MLNRHKIILICTLLLTSLTGFAQQRFFNLTAEDVRIDSLLPEFVCAIPVTGNYQDSIYHVTIKYPEFIDMGEADIARCKKITKGQLSEMPVITQRMVVERRKARLEVFLTPVTLRKGKYKKLVSFMLDVTAMPKQEARSKGQGVKMPKRAASRAKDATGRYAEKSVLAEGTWAKIRVPVTGIYQLTSNVKAKAGFTDLSKVHVYGYGGALQQEELDPEYLTETDDLDEVPLCIEGDKRLFFAQGPVTWGDDGVRVRNPYSDYGYYFITQNDQKVETIEKDAFLKENFPATYQQHTLYEIDDYAWFEGGRNLFEDSPIAAGASKTYTITLQEGKASSGMMRVKVSAGSKTVASVSINGTEVGKLSMSLGSYDHGAEATGEYAVQESKASHEVKITTVSGGPVRLDYIDFTSSETPSVPSLEGTFPEPEYVYNITNQNLHADEDIQMVIVIPTSGKLRTQAERLKEIHEKKDEITVKIVPADELYNEFSSGTPDVNAYRRYMKMLYDRAETDEEMPRYIVLFGDCAWDNRMKSVYWKNYSVDDFLLCYESENSFSKVYSYVDDGFFCSLDDGEGGKAMTSDKHDIAVGRFPVRDADQAKIMIDKTENYINNANAGSWQNIVMAMGDDGNNNLHMKDADVMAGCVEELNSGMYVKRVMWDAYTRVTSSTGARYPEVTNIVKQQQQSGALIMNYSGHGSETAISHEIVLRVADFQNFTNNNLPLWITASCDIGPFDGQTTNIGEESVLNKKGGAVAFYGTTRTVYTDRNRAINRAFLTAIFTPKDDGSYVSLGEAQRIAKNNLITTRADITQNKLQYSLLGDPALVLHIPTLRVVVDSINGEKVETNVVSSLLAGSVATVKGHIEKDEKLHSSFNGTLSAVVRDSKETITCRLNNTTSEGADEPYVYIDRTKVLYQGNDSVRGGKFTISFVVPKDLNYKDETGLMNFHAVSNDHKELANGAWDDFMVGGSDIENTDTKGPSIYCYLNSPSFVNGGNVNTTPYFAAEISDKDGINTTGNGIGHDLELIIDGEMSRTYNLNDNFAYDFGSYTSGKTYYSVPELTAGQHQLKFRAWDMLNNSTTAELTFNVVKGLEPNFFNVSLSHNPAKTQTDFIIVHDRTGSPIDIEIDLFDMSGRQLWKYKESGISDTGTYTIPWNLAVDGGRRLETGVYVYRVLLSSDGSSQASKAKKLIVINNK